MRALEIRRPGRPPVVTERPAPAAGAGEALVEVLAAPITPLDVLCASGTSYFGTPSTPYVPGVQGVGTAGGRLVWFPTSAGMAPGDGSMAEVVRVPEADLVELPEGAGPVAVAALGLSAVAAYLALTWRGELAAGEQVIVLGAGGVVGQAAVQLARIAGARRVVGAARSASGRERAKEAGADAVVALDTDDVAELAARARRSPTGRPTWSSTRCSARRQPPPRARCGPAAGWSTSGARPRRRARSTRPRCAAGRCGCSATRIVGSAPGFSPGVKPIVPA